MPRYINLIEYLSHVCAVAEEYGFVTTRVAQRNTALSSTAFRAHDNMFPLKHNPSVPIPVTKEHLAHAREIIKWAQRYFRKAVADETANDFESIMASLITGKEFEIRFEGHIASLHLSYRKTTQKTSRVGGKK